MVACGVATALPVGLASTASAAVSSEKMTSEKGAAAAVPSLAGFHLGGDGRLYAAGPSTLGRAGAAVIGAPGGGVATVRRSDGLVAVFTVGTHGGLVAGFTSAAGSGLSFVWHPQGGVAPPGGRIAAVEGLTGTHVFLTGVNGAVYHAMYSRSGALGLPLAPVTPTGSVPQTTSLAAFAVGDRFGVVFVGGDRAVRVAVGRIGSGPAGPIPIWTTTAATQPNVAPLGSPVAAASGTGGAATFFTGVDGRVWRIPVAGVTPQQPVALSGPGTVPVGAQLAATMAPTGEFVVTYAGADGAIRAATDAFTPLPDPWVIAPPGAHAPGGPLGLTYGGDDYLYLGWCGLDRWFWLIWWWLHRRFPPPPPPPPDPYHDLFGIPSVLPMRTNFAVGVTLTQPQ